MVRQIFLAGLVLSLIAYGAACSGGGDAPAQIAQAPPPVSPPPPTGSSGDPIFIPGVFDPADDFADQCEVVRIGRNIEGNTYPDIAGSTLIEQFWLRSWTNETYLWPDEVVDQDPNLYDSSIGYFGELKTLEKTASGEDKDDFHFSESTEAFLERRNSAASPAYGARYIALSSGVPRDFRILFTEPGSPAAETVLGQPNLVRGSRILEIDGIDFVNGATNQEEVDLLNAALFPSTVGEQHTFVVSDPGSADPRTTTLTAANISPVPVNRTEIISTPNGNVGYILFNTFSPFSSEEEIANAITEMQQANVSDLVLDLRYNGGGLLAVAAQLSYMIAGDARTAGRTFETLRFNEKSGNVNPVTGSTDNAIPFYNSGLGFSLVNGERLDALDLPRVFILTTERTCSASEAVVNGLNGIGVEVILIGNTTCGKPFGFYPTDNCGETYYTIQFQGVNDESFGDYTDGFIPGDSTAPFGVRLSGCVIGDDYDNELGDPNESLLSAALEFRETGACPAPTPQTPAAAPSASSAKGSGIPDERADNRFDVKETDLTPLDEFILNNRDLTMPY